jgi:NAD(P)-dependent dehydrogenase (short-subunit alcohol dehydrogenase family)
MKILVTGGTSGLGLELVKIFLEKGFHVVATGRRSIDLPGFENKFKSFIIDFSDLRQTAIVTREICDTYKFDIVINNAGILSPKNFTSTGDGYEYTFQVNFLAHLLINEIIRLKQEKISPLKVAAVTSPVYRIAKSDLSYIQNSENYNPVKAYSDSKLYLVLMCRHLSLKYQVRDTIYFSFIPGIFGSGIYRMQTPLFHSLYHIASPFMKSPAKVAKVLTEILFEVNIINGSVYDMKKRIRKLPEIDISVNDAFWKESYRKIDPFLR